jgi:DNA-binding FrmR family transcriptional regulator
MKSPAKSAATCHHHPVTHRSVVQPRKRTLLNRLKRAEGQLQAVSRMVAEDRYCVDILTQMSAVQAALRSAAVEILDDHTRGCVINAVRSGKGESEITELLALLHRFAR